MYFFSGVLTNGHIGIVDTEDMKGENGWNLNVEFSETHYQKDENSLCFEKWNIFQRKSGIINRRLYIICCEKH